MTCLEEELRAESNAFCDSDVCASSLANFNRASSSSRNLILRKFSSCASQRRWCPSKKREGTTYLGGRGTGILEVVRRKMQQSPKVSGDRSERRYLREIKSNGDIVKRVLDG